jgi:peptidoglycan/LPS O-acetylase OafA/YrhL
MSNIPVVGDPKSGSSAKRLEHIDALRGIAALGVVWAHCGNAVSGLPDWLTRYTFAGGYGVQLFYIISAYTLLLSLKNRRARESAPTRNFFIRRWFRIAPLYYVAIALYASSDFLSHSYWTPNGVTTGAIVANLLLVHGWHPTYINGAVHGGWSVGVEFSFYLLFPFLARRLKSVWQCLFWFVVFTIFAGPVRIALGSLTMRALGPEGNGLWIPFYDFWLPSQMPAFLLGFAVFYLVKEKRPMKEGEEGKGVMAPVLVFGGIWCLLCLPFVDSRFLPVRIMAAVALAAVVFALCFRPYPLFVNRFLIGCGKISYSMYLLHIAVLKVLQQWVIPSIMPAGAGPIPRFLVTTGLTMSLTIVVSILTYNAIERPFMAFGSRLIKALELRGNQTDAATAPA